MVFAKLKKFLLELKNKIKCKCTCSCMSHDDNSFNITNIVNQNQSPEIGRKTNPVLFSVEE